MLSRRLQLLALPIYLSHEGGPDGRRTWNTKDMAINNGSGTSVIRRLPSSLHPKSLTIFSTGNLFVVFNYLQKLQLVIPNLSGLEKVRLDFRLIILSF
jgi:hypothetical protein